RIRIAGDGSFRRRQYEDRNPRRRGTGVAGLGAFYRRPSHGRQIRLGRRASRPGVVSRGHVYALSGRAPCGRRFTASAPLGAGAFRALGRGVGASGPRPLVLAAATHARLAAYVSHLPQLLSTALANLITQATPDDQPALAIRVSAGAFRDMIRLAASPYAIWG